jgi:hypothetical protein
MRCTSLGVFGLSALMAGCCRPVAPEVVRVTVPPALTAPCVLEARPDTVGALYEAFEDALTVVAECNGRLEQIRGLK